METQTEQQKQTSTEQLVKLDMTIGDIINKYPSTVEVLLKNGIHCVGCGAKTFETLGDGLRGHGLSDEKINTILDELNNSIERLEGQGDIEITSKAVEKLKDLLKANEKEGHGLRIMVVPGGCAGFQYGFDFENQAKDDDLVLEVGGVNFYIDAASQGHLKGARIDYIDTLQESGFRISNPNASGGCGCGKSFS